MPPNKKRSASGLSTASFLCVMVTGMSGAGKSQAIKCLEDFGFFCVDNLPAPLLPQFADLIIRSGKSMQKVALGIDVREGKFFDGLSNLFQEFKSRGILTWTLFLDADNATLLRRFSETRRKHPLGKGVLEGIQEERKRLREIRSRADKIIETSNMTLSDLKDVIAASLPTSSGQRTQISVCSFGYKYGLPTDADLVWDVRFLPNPNYVPSLHKKTGLTKEVRNFVMRNPASRKFLKRFFSLIQDCLPQYMKEGKSHLTIAIGCTGGRHRSVTIAEKLLSFLRGKGYPVSIRHRDIEQ